MVWERRGGWVGCKGQKGGPPQYVKKRKDSYDSHKVRAKKKDLQNTGELLCTYLFINPVNKISENSLIISFLWTILRTLSFRFRICLASPDS